jgi:peroxiredoxin
LAELRFLVKPKEKVRLFAISVDKPEDAAKTAEKIAADGRGSLNFAILSDPDHKTIDAYGLHDPAYDGGRFSGIPHPAVYLIDKSGRVVWVKVEQNYRERPTNADIRVAIDKLRSRKQ